MSAFEIGIRKRGGGLSSKLRELNEVAKGDVVGKDKRRDWLEHRIEILKWRKGVEPDRIAARVQAGRFGSRVEFPGSLTSVRVSVRLDHLLLFDSLNH